MALAQDITLNPLQQQAAGPDLMPSAKARHSGIAGEDLFQKFILDKESASVSGEKPVFEEHALDKEEVETNGFLSSREQQTVERNIERKSNAITSRKTPAQSRSGLSRTTPFHKEAPAKNVPAKVESKKSGKADGPRSPTMTSGVEFRLSRASAAKTAQVQNAPQPQNANLQTVAGSDASKPQTLMKKLMPARPKVVQEKPVVSQVQSSKTPILGKMDAPTPSSGQQGESSTTNSNSQGGSQEQNPSERQGFTPLPEVVSPAQSETIHQFNASAGQGNVPNGQQAGVYGGVISQLTQQFWRLQQNSGTATTRLTLDLPDGEKLLVRFHVRANQGMQVQFSTKSRGLRNALEQSWEHLKVEAGQRGITLGDPEFEGEGIDVETTDTGYLPLPARAVR